MARLPALRRPPLARAGPLAHTRHPAGGGHHPPRSAGPPTASGLSRRHHECIWLSPRRLRPLDDRPPSWRCTHVTGYPAGLGGEPAHGAGHGPSRRRLPRLRLALPLQPDRRARADVPGDRGRRPGGRRPTASGTPMARPDRNRWYGRRSRGPHGPLVRPDQRRGPGVCGSSATGAGEEDPRLPPPRRAGGPCTKRPGTRSTPTPWCPSSRATPPAPGAATPPEREDPLRWGIAHATQHILAAVREMMYASRALAEARRK